MVTLCRYALIPVAKVAQSYSREMREYCAVSVPHCVGRAISIRMAADHWRESKYKKLVKAWLGLNQ